MAEKKVSIKQLSQKLAQYRERRIRLFLLLGIQLLIMWLLNPGFIPPLEGIVNTVSEFLSQLLWPHDLAELQTGSYRVYIYELCTWVQDLLLYPLLEWAVPRILPVWLIITQIQIWVVSLRIKIQSKKTEKDPNDKPKKKKRALPKLRFPTGPKVSGLYWGARNDVQKRFQQLQSSWQNSFSQEQGVMDYGLWLSNMAPDEGNITPSDKILSWDANGTISIPYMNRSLRFKLIDQTAHWIVHGSNSVPLQRGVPFVLKHKNEAGMDIIDMTITWLGGNV